MFSIGKFVPGLEEVVDEVLKARSAGSPTDEAVRWTDLVLVQQVLAGTGYRRRSLRKALRGIHKAQGIHQGFPRIGDLHPVIEDLHCRARSSHKKNPSGSRRWLPAPESLVRGTWRPSGAVLARLFRWSAPVS